MAGRSQLAVVDADVVEYDTTGPKGSVAYDAFAQDPDWAAADVDALPDPVFPFLLVGIPRCWRWVNRGGRK